MPAARRPIVLRAPVTTRWFIRRLQAISPGTIRAFSIPHSADDLTNVLNTDGRVWTNSETAQGRITRQGKGVLVSYNGTNQYATTPDTADLSLVEPTPISIVVAANVTNTAALRVLISKWNDTTNVSEWMFYIDGSDLLTLLFRDQTAAVQTNRRSSAAITQGSLRIFGTSYSGVGGASAADGIALYENGAPITSVAVNNAAYVSMQDSATAVHIGSDANLSYDFVGQGGFAVVYAANLSPAQHAAIAIAAARYYGSALAA